MRMYQNFAASMRKCLALRLMIYEKLKLTKNDHHDQRKGESQREKEREIEREKKGSEREGARK